MVLKKFILSLDMVYDYDKTNFLTELASVWPCITLKLYNFANKILNPVTKVIYFEVWGVISPVIRW